MFVEELTAIRKAEAEAEQIKKDARAEAKSIVEKARADAQRILNSAEAKAKDGYDSLVKEGNEIAQKEYDEALKDAEAKALIMEEAAKKKDAVGYIVERIVKLSVNS